MSRRRAGCPGRRRQDEQDFSGFTCSILKNLVNPVYYFFINSSTAEVVAFTPVLSVGSGTGANRAEWRPGSATPDSRLAFTFAGSDAPSQIIVAGMLWSRLKYPKSSLAIIGGICTTFSSPSA